MPTVPADEFIVFYGKTTVNCDDRICCRRITAYTAQKAVDKIRRSWRTGTIRQEVVAVYDILGNEKDFD